MAISEEYLENMDTIATIDTNLDTVSDNVDTVEGYTEKIDNTATLGLLGTSNSLSYRTHELGKHLYAG